MSHPPKLFEGSVLLLGPRGALAGDCRGLLEGRGYHMLHAADADEATTLLRRRSDIVLVIACGGASLENDILAMRAVKASALHAPWLEYIVLSQASSAESRVTVSDVERDGILPVEDRGLTLSAIAEAFNLARLKHYQMSELSDLERALQEFRTRTEMAMSQLLSRARGHAPADAGEETGPAEPASNDMARAMEDERARARVREKFFGAFRLGHAGWMLLLVLAEVQGAGNELTVKSAAYAAGIPLSSALRKIGEMCEDGLLSRRADPTDNRRSFVMLTDRARTLLGEYLTAVRRAGRG